MQVGYACINQTLGGNCDRTFKETGSRCSSCFKCLGGRLKDKIYTNRTCIARTFDILSVNQKIIDNLDDLLTILRWNESNGIRFMRLSSEIFPFISHDRLGYTIDDLPSADLIKSKLRQIGDYATENLHRLTSHPGPYNVLGSKKPDF
jgi:UV DNA damage endonuclease